MLTVLLSFLVQVLRFGYIMIRIDGYETDETGSDWFCYHASSPLIFPPGFSEKNRIKVFFSGMLVHYSALIFDIYH